MNGLHLIVLTTALLAGLASGRSTRGVGKAGDIREAPWLAQIEYADKHGHFFGEEDGSCAGSIIDSTHILSAWHCFKDEFIANPDRIRVRVGATETAYGGDKYRAESIVAHPKAGGTLNGAFDLAVVTLKEPIRFSDAVQPIQLASKAVATGSLVMGGGWGVTSEGEDATIADNLLLYSMERLNTEECQWRVAGAPMNKETKESIMCMVPHGGIACGGDSGSGLWLPAADGQPAQLFGVLSSGTVCDANDPNATNLYTDLLSEHVRDFLGQFFDMEGRQVVRASKRAEEKQAEEQVVQTPPQPESSEDGSAFFPMLQLVSGEDANVDLRVLLGLI